MCLTGQEASSPVPQFPHPIPKQESLTPEGGKKLLLSEQDSIKKMCLALTGQIPGIGDFHRSQF